MQSEFEFIQKIRQQAFSNSIKIGIGDDCAVISKDAQTDLVMTTDLLVEDIDFRRKWMVPEFLGHKALAISLSDVAAMGAKPVWSMLSIGIPNEIWNTDFVDKFYDGWFKLAKKYNVQLIGGDVSKTPDKIVIDSIVAGEVKKNKAVLRSTAQPNDLIFVSGELGGASIGLKLLENGNKFDAFNNSKTQNLILRQLKPNPQIEIAQILSKNNLATAMIDLSDGLSGDLAHLCRESKVGSEIFAENIPIDRNLETDAKNLQFALKGGEDFELLFTVNPKNRKKLLEKLNFFSVTEIGKITAQKVQIFLIENDCKTILNSTSYNHF